MEIQDLKIYIKLAVHPLIATKTHVRITFKSPDDD